MNDIKTDLGKPWCGMNTIDIHSLRDGFLGTLVAESDDCLRMSIVSVVDHITEPRSVKNYSLEKTEHFSPRWELLWEVNPRDKVLLGEFTSQQGAQKILDYLKSNAQ